MADSALFLLWASFVAAVVAALASVLYAVQPWLAAAFAARSVPAADIPVTDPSLPAQPPPAAPLARSATLGGMATLSTWVAAALGLIGLTLRGIALNHAPYSNLFEFSMAFGIAIVLLYAIFEYRSGTRLAGSFVLPIACALYASALAFPSQGQEILVPALQSPTLLTIHVALMILSYAVLAVAFGAAAMHLVQGLRSARPAGRFAFLPDPDRCDQLTYRAVLIGFPLLAAGIALGAFWANDAWGRYWGWDPKETAALVTWLIFAVYIHARGLRGLRGARSAWIVVLGFAAVLFTYLGVNLWIAGLHSYAGV